MTKYDKFVGKENVNLSQTEVEAIKKHFNDVLIERHGLHFLKLDNSKEDGNNDREYLSINFTCDKIKKRNVLGERIIFTGLTFMVYKKKGYLDLTDWTKSANERKIVKDYENAPDYQYSVNIVPFGSVIKYRGRTKQSWGLSDSYQYDTEIKEITFYSALTELKRRLK